MPVFDSAWHQSQLNSDTNDDVRELVAIWFHEMTAKPVKHEAVYKQQYVYYLALIGPHSKSLYALSKNSHLLGFWRHPCAGILSGLHITETNKTKGLRKRKGGNKTKA